MIGQMNVQLGRAKPAFSKKPIVSVATAEQPNPKASASNATCRCNSSRRRTYRNMMMGTSAAGSTGATAIGMRQDDCGLALRWLTEKYKIGMYATIAISISTVYRQ